MEIVVTSIGKGNNFGGTVQQLKFCVSLKCFLYLLYYHNFAVEAVLEQ